jgi:hypothetical protein
MSTPPHSPSAPPRYRRNVLKQVVTPSSLPWLPFFTSTRILRRSSTRGLDRVHVYSLETRGVIAAINAVVSVIVKRL